MRTQKRLAYNLEVAPSQFVSFDDVLKDATAIDDYVEHEFKSGTEAHRILFSKPRRSRTRKITLYYDPIFSLPLNLQKDLMLKGYRFIEDPHPSLLINSMSILSEKLLDQIGVPWYASILLPSDPIDVDGIKCYFSIGRNGLGGFHLKMHPAEYDPSDCLILLEKF